jgi:hypothetical protein
MPRMSSKSQLLAEAVTMPSRLFSEQASCGLRLQAIIQFTSRNSR